MLVVNQKSSQNHTQPSGTAGTNEQILWLLGGLIATWAEKGGNEDSEHR